MYAKFSHILDLPPQYIPEPARIEQTHNWEISPLFEKLQWTSGQVGGHCVAWLQHLLNFPEGFKGNAWAIRPNTQQGEVGDIVIFVNDKEVTVEKPLSNLIAEHKKGDKITLKVLRSGSEIDLPVQL